MCLACYLNSWTRIIVFSRQMIQVNQNKITALINNLPSSRWWKVIGGCCAQGKQCRVIEWTFCVGFYLFDTNHILIVCLAWIFRFLREFSGNWKFCLNAVCRFHCSSSVCYCCSLVPGIWAVLTLWLPLSFLLQKAALWLLSNSLCSLPRFPHSLQHLCYVDASFSLSLSLSLSHTHTHMRAYVHAPVYTCINLLWRN